MEDGLAGVAVRVEHRPEAAGRDAAILGDRRGASDDFPHNLIVTLGELVERRDVPFRDDQDVRRPLRVDVVEREDAIVFVND